MIGVDYLEARAATTGGEVLARRFRMSPRPAEGKRKRRDSRGRRSRRWRIVGRGRRRFIDRGSIASPEAFRSGRAQSSGRVEAAPGPDDLAEDRARRPSRRAPSGSADARGWLIRAEDQVPAGEVEPADHRDAVGAGRDHLALQPLGVGHRAIDGHDRAGREDREHRLVVEPDGDGLPGMGQPLAIGQDVALDAAGFDRPLEPRSASGTSETATKSEDESRRQIVRTRSRRSSLGCCSSFSSPRRISWIGVSSERRPSLGLAAITLAFAGEQPDRVGAGLIDEGEQDLGRHGHAGLVVVPGPRRQVEASGQFGAAMLAEEFLADLAKPSRDRRLDVDSDFRCFFSGHGMPSRERESLTGPLNRPRKATSSTGQSESHQETAEGTSIGQDDPDSTHRAAF